MKHATKYLLALTLASSVSMADEVEDINADPNYNPNAGTPTPVVLVATAPVPLFVQKDMVWNVPQAAAQITQLLSATVPDIADMKIVVSQLSLDTLAGVVASMVNTPEAFNILVPQLTPAQTQGIIATLANDPAVFKVFVAQMTPDQVEGVVAYLVSSPATFKVFVAQMSSTQVKGVIASLVNNPKTLSILVSTLSLDQLEKVTLDTFKSPQTFCAFVAQFSPTQLSTILASLAKNPEAATAIYNTISPAQYQAVMAELAKNPNAFTVVASGVTSDNIIKAYLSLSAINDLASFQILASKVDPSKLRQAEISLFLIDLDAWLKFSAFLKEPDAAANVGKLGNNWMDAARAKLRRRYEKEGCSPAVIAEAEAMMKRATAAAPTPPKLTVKPTQ